MQESTEMSKVFQIPIEKFENDMNTESSREKKKEILKLFTTYNKICSEEEFNNIEYDLHEACKEGDLEMIKIFLSKKIEDSTYTLTFKIDETNQTASVFEVERDVEEVYIPRTVKHECTEYLITSIIGICYYIKTIKFCEDSAVKTFYKYALSYSNVEEIYFPSSLKELKDGWCSRTENLKKIIISPSNGQYEYKEDNYLVYKNEPNKDEFDELLFVRRDIEEFSIPSNIKIISSYSFHYSKIKSICIPSNVSKICNSAFSDCYHLLKVEIPNNSNLQTIESFAFSHCKIESIFIPSNVSKICNSAFSDCCNLLKVEIPKNSNLQTIESFAFCYSKIEEIYFPSSLKELKDGWCKGIDYLKKIIISPSNGQYEYKENKYLICKCELSKDEFDELLFVRRDIEEFSIPSNIKIISSYSFHYSKIKSICIPSKVTKICEYAFSYCRNLKKVEIPNNSNLQTIESYAFYNSNIKSIYIPSKVSKICNSAFSDCRNLQIIEISEESKLKLFPLKAFKSSQQVIILIPTSLKKID